MIYNLEIKEEADLEITEAYLFYESKLSGLGEKFLDQLDIYIKRICENPKHFAIKKKNYREAYLVKFPYLIVFEIEEKNVVVYSIFNTPQDPEKKPK